MRLVFFSDTHSLHNVMLSPLPKGDVLIHSGDVTNIGTESEIIEFVKWFNDLEGYQHKIFIAGNHDFGFEDNRIRHGNDLPWLDRLVEEGKLPKLNCIYLEDSEYIINSDEFSKPIKVYGSPWQPEFFNWAFNLPRNGVDIQDKWNQIPEDTDILITHSPPYGILDYTLMNQSVGCEFLRYKVNQLKPIINCFGHIHCARGIKEIDDTLFINSSICTEQYKPKNNPIVLDLIERDGQFLKFVVYD